MLFKKQGKDHLDSLREQMVETQIIARGIRDERTLEAMRKIRRELFVLENMREEAYNDYPLPIGFGQTISQPYIVALMTELLELKGEEKVLEIGTGSGYQTAILAELAKEVYTVERIPELVNQASVRLGRMGYKNVYFFCADGSQGLPEHAPYQGILVTAAAQETPQPLLEQLDEKGRLVIPVGERYSQVLAVLEKKKGKMTEREVCGCTFVPLVGKYGWEE